MFPTNIANRVSNFASSSADHVGMVTVGALAGGLIGQAAIPIPILGGVVGAMAGGYLTHKGIGAIKTGTGIIFNSIINPCKPILNALKTIICLPFRILFFVLKVVFYPIIKLNEYLARNDVSTPPVVVTFVPPAPTVATIATPIIPTVVPDPDRNASLGRIVVTGLGKVGMKFGKDALGLTACVGSEVLSGAAGLGKRVIIGGAKSLGYYAVRVLVR